jgi:integrase
MLEKLYDHLSKIEIPSSGTQPKYLSNSSVRYVHATIRAALNDAVKKRILNYNPCLAVTLESRDKYEARTLTREELTVFIKACENFPFGLDLLLMLLLGLRRGEALGLSFSDLDFSKKEAHIQQQYTTCGKDANGKQLWGLRSLKTKESDRIVGIPSQLIDLLVDRKKVVNQQKIQNSNNYYDNDLICCDSNGTPRQIVTIEHAFKRMLKANGLPNIRLHDLRHTYATQLLDQNVDLKSISQSLGHTSIKTTADIYIGKNNAAASRTAAAMENLVSQVVSSNPTDSSISRHNSTTGKVLTFPERKAN